MRRKFGVFAVAGGMHTEVETGKGAVRWTPTVRQPEPLFKV
jgi:hypothetical protein